MHTLHDVFIEELQELYDAENQIVMALPKMAEAASHADLKAAFEEHLLQSQDHIERLEEISENLDLKMTGKTNKVVQELIAHGEEIIKTEGDMAVKDAALIAAAQKVEHYEISGYGTATAWAKEMEHEEATKLLAETLKEEKATDEKLSKLAQGGLITEGVNEMADGE